MVERPMSGTLPTAADKPRYVASMFGRIAGRYDLMNSLMTGGLDRGWRVRVAEEVQSALERRGLGANAQARVLDVGTGTGRLSVTLERTLPRATVVGVDFSDPMLRAAPAGLKLGRADAIRLPFADASFDAAVSAFLMRNLADAEQGIAESIRVLRPGGTLVILETTPGPPGLLRAPYRLYFRWLVPVLGGLIAGDPSAYTYLPESTLAFLEPARLADLLRRHGLTEVRTIRLAVGTVALTIGRRA